MVEIAVSMEAAVEMKDDPSGSAQQLVSFWDSGLAGIRAVRFINWLRRVDAGVACVRSINT